MIECFPRQDIAAASRPVESRPAFIVKALRPIESAHAWGAVMDLSSGASLDDGNQA